MAGQTESQPARIPEEDGTFLGYGQIVNRTTPRYGPGTWFSMHNEMPPYEGYYVAVIREQDGFCLTECYNENGEKFRSWISVSDVSELMQELR